MTPAATATRTPAAWAGHLYDDAILAGQGPLFLRRDDGWMLPLPVERWCEPPDAADTGLLRRCGGAVLDIGCGPGRFVTALHQRGRPVLGVDVSLAAVARTVETGAPAVRGSIFDPVPEEGRWDTALLADGNIGIGGDVARLLRRVAQVVHPDGRLLAELAYDDVDETLSVRVDDGDGRSGAAFPWARVGASAAERYASVAGWRIAETWCHEASRRRFVCLRLT
ncbi:class I SAM-dependent methyltransferase [Stackebrandtia nassauensis]|uniref:Methyltransferase type 12 n=1 Tax=Stackebrandtia nassauensis (strain DSM 44728 / CIP 108903 / NRRL B-16338 / NBRC 102104 / LLR-40K-21) TaxID=446470 RepID=D3Q9B3_STANL|nr:class I SAM-dependent methyltransferase [Stackebrandtia nassauensis]ADD42595.1 Methyltransferase type 12 [Stackebrandtia nassauensis DSM 44728]